MEWSSKFSSIVKETESNLAKVKEKLHSLPTSDLGSETTDSSFLKTYNTEGLAPSQEYNSRHSFGLLSTAQSTTPSYIPYYRTNIKNDPYVTHSSNLTSPLTNGGSVLNQDTNNLYTSSGMLTLLHDKIDNQSKTIESLVHTVNRLEDERNTYARQVKELRDDIAQLNSRISGRGVDLQTEHKMEQWKQDIAIQISDLKSQLQSSQGQGWNGKSHGVYADTHHTNNITRDLNDLKRCITTECDNLRYGVESVKNRLSRLEVDMSSTGAEHRTLMQRSSVTDMNLRNFMSSQSNEANSRNQSETGMSQLKSSIDNIRDRLFGMETNIHRTNSLISPSYTKPPSRRSYSPKKHTSVTNIPTLTLSPDTSDIDLSDTVDLDDGSVGGLSFLSQDKHRKTASAGGGILKNSQPYGDLDDVDLSADELDDGDFDDVKTADLEDIVTANTLDLQLTDDEDDDIENDHELSIDELN